MKNKNFGRKRQAIYILSNRKSTRIIKTLMDFFFFIKVKIKMVCFSVPSSQTGGCFCSLAIAVTEILSAMNINISTISNLIIISQLNHFTFVSALLLPVLRLNLTLPLRLQGFGTGGWLNLT